MNTIVTFDQNVSSNTRRRVLIRAGWITRIAPLGKLNGTEHTLFGATLDAYADAGQDAIVYGIADAHTLAQVESKIGSLADVMARGDIIQAMRENTTPSAPRLTWIGKHVNTASERASIPTYKEWLDQTKFPAHGEHAQLRAGALFQRQQKEDFLRRWQISLELRKTWNISMMRHRSDFPDWLPRWIQELIREHSRTWLELSTLAPPVLTPPLPITGSEATSTPAVARGSGILARLGIVN